MKNLFLSLLFSTALIFAQEEKEVIIKKIGKDGKVTTQTFSGDEAMEKGKNITVTAHVGEGVMKKLKLSDEQKAKVDKIYFESKKNAIELGAKIALLKLELASLMKEDNIDKSAIKNKIKELSDKATSLATNKLDDWFKVNELLNAEQKKTWREVLKNRSRMGAHKFRMNGMPPPKFHFRGRDDDDSFNFDMKEDIDVEIETDALGSMDYFYELWDDQLMSLPKITKGFKIKDIKGDAVLDGIEIETDGSGSGYIIRED